MLVCGAPCCRLVLRPTDSELAETRLTDAIIRLELPEELRSGRGADEAIADTPRRLGGFRATGRHHDRRGMVRHGVDASVLHHIVTSSVRLWPSPPQQPDDLHRLLQHLQAQIVRRPAIAEDVLVEILAGAN